MQSQWMPALLVGCGAFVGGVLRWTLGGLVHRQLPMSTFPWGTLCVNLVGCAAIGLLAALADGRALFSPQARALVFVGLLGGFTTFSSFALESFALLRDGEHLRALGYVAAHNLLGIGVCALAYLTVLARTT